jgi:hypothetical protein
MKNPGGASEATSKACGEGYEKRQKACPCALELLGFAGSERSAKD